MNNVTALEDRRKHKRHDAFSGVFAVNSYLGLIVDISMGGLSFRYVDRGAWSANSVNSGVLFGEADMLIDNIPIKSISKSYSEKDGNIVCEDVKCRRAEFGNLTPEQKKILERFICINARCSSNSPMTT